MEVWLMLQYDSDKIFNLLCEFENQTKIISNEIMKIKSMEAKDFQNLNHLYFCRKDIADQLDSIFKSSVWHEIYSSDKLYWDEKINTIKTAEKDNLDFLEKNVKIIGGQLRNFHKTKSVLIYTSS